MSLLRTEILATLLEILCDVFPPRTKILATPLVSINFCPPLHKSWLRAWRRQHRAGGRRGSRRRISLQAPRRTLVLSDEHGHFPFFLATVSCSILLQSLCPASALWKDRFYILDASCISLLDNLDLCVRLLPALAHVVKALWIHYIIIWPKNLERKTQRANGGLQIKQPSFYCIIIA